MAFLQTVLIIILVYYFLKMVLRFFAPKILHYAAKKAEAHFKNTFDGFNTHSQSHKNEKGEVVLDKKTKNKKGDSEKVGEYIDFEEID